MKKNIFIFLLFLYLPVHGQLHTDYRIQQINKLEDLPSKQINCIFQDSDGYMWFGTTEGLCRYDGYTIKTYKSSLQSAVMLCSNLITAIVEDKQKRLWIGTNLGLNIYDKKSGEISKVDLPVPTTYVRKLLFTKKSQLWIGTEMGLYLYNEESNSFIRFVNEESNINSLNGNNIRTLCESHDGNIWVGLWDKGLCKINPENFHISRYPEVCFRNRISSIFEDKNKRLWIGAWADGFYQALYEDDPSKTIYVRMDQESHYERLIHSIIQEEDGNILAGTGLGLDILSYQTDKPIYISSEDQRIINMPNSEINDLYIGANGIIWIATQGSGVYQLFKEKQVFSNHIYETLGDLKQPTSINAFYEWGDDLIIGIDKIGLARFNKKNQQITPCQNDPELNKIPFPMGNIKCFFKHPSKNEL